MCTQIFEVTDHNAFMEAEAHPRSGKSKQRQRLMVLPVHAKWEHFSD